MKNLLEIITDNRVGYKFSCDDRKTSMDGVASTVPTDAYFTLTDIDRLNKLLNICNQFHLNYDLWLEEW